MKTRMNNELTLECSEMHDNYITTWSKVFSDLPSEVLSLYLSVSVYRSLYKVI